MTTKLCLQGGLDAPAAARSWLAGNGDWASDRQRDEAALMLGEVVTNAVLHGGVGPGSELRIDVRADDDTIAFDVYDFGAGFLPPLLDVPERKRGYGLYIVDRLARRWGVRQVPGGACVWFEAAMGGAQGE